jgi:hypothetical protein
MKEMINKRERLLCVCFVNVIVSFVNLFFLIIINSDRKIAENEEGEEKGRGGGRKIAIIYSKKKKALIDRIRVQTKTSQHVSPKTLSNSNWCKQRYKVCRQLPSLLWCACP